MRPVLTVTPAKDRHTRESGGPCTTSRGRMHPALVTMDSRFRGNDGAGRNDDGPAGMTTADIR